jgi:hypothetical protein
MKDLLSGMGLTFGMTIPNFPDPELMDQSEDELDEEIDVGEDSLPEAVD